jgi:hypothetical protein
MTLCQRRAMPKPADYDGPIWFWVQALVRRGLWNGVSFYGLGRLIIPGAAYQEIRRECLKRAQDYPLRQAGGFDYRELLRHYRRPKTEDHLFKSDEAAARR